MIIPANKQRARARLAKALGAVAAVVVIGINVFTINCGQPPTDVGLDKPSPEPTGKVENQPDNASAISLLTAGHAIEYVSATRTTCIAFSSPCSVRNRPSGGTASAAITGSCQFVDGEANTHSLTCQTPAGLTCVLGVAGTEVGSLATNVDFDSVLTDHPKGAGLDGYVVNDNRDPDVKLTFHDDVNYCAATFALED